MTTVAIPEWNARGFLPPLDPMDPTGPQRSPYAVALLDLVMRFSSSPERRQLLLGFLAYRAALHGMGLVAGMQWLNGSFLEQVETLEGRAPRDIDVVSFVRTPAGFAPSADDLAVLDHGTTKARFHVDSYLVGLDELHIADIVAQAAYWYGMWSHRRDLTWKGYLQVDLDPAADVLATRWLSRYDAGERQP